MGKLRSFKTELTFHRSKEANHELQDEAKENNFPQEVIENLIWTGYEIIIPVEVFEDGTVIVNGEVGGL